MIKRPGLFAQVQKIHCRTGLETFRKKWKSKFPHFDSKTIKNTSLINGLKTFFKVKNLNNLNDYLIFFGRKIQFSHFQFFQNVSNPVIGNKRKCVIIIDYSLRRLPRGYEGIYWGKKYLRPCIQIVLEGCLILKTPSLVNLYLCLIPLSSK